MLMYKTLTLFCLAICLLGFGAVGQNISITRKDALRVLAAADSAKVHKLHIALLLKDTALYGARIREIEASKQILLVTIGSYKRDSTNYAKIIKLTEDQKTLAEQEIEVWKKEYRKEKRKRFWTGVSGAVLTGAAILIKSRQ